MFRIGFAYWMLYLLLILSIWWWLHRKACNRKLHVTLFIYDKNVDVKTSSLSVLMEYLHQLWPPWPNTGWRWVSVSIQTKEHQQISRTLLMFLAIPVRRIGVSTAKCFVYFLLILSETDEGYSKTWSITASEINNPGGYHLPSNQCVGTDMVYNIYI